MIRALLGSVLLLLHPHSAPTLWLDAEIAADRVTMVVCIRVDHIDPWLVGGPEPGALVDGMTEEEHDAACATLERYFAKANRVYADDEALIPYCTKIDSPEDLEGRKQIDYFAIHLVYPIENTPKKDWPKKVRFVWDDFEGASFQKEEIVPATLRFGAQVEAMGFDPQQNRFTWAYPEYGLPTREEVRAVSAPPVPRIDWTPHIVLGVLALIWAIALGWAGAGAGAWLAMLLLVGASGYALPWKVSEKPILTEPQAGTVFETLLANVYRAFETVTEGEGYDLLAYSLEPDLVGPLYLEMRESLEMRDHGAAVASIGEIEGRGGTVTFTGPRSFDVRWRWQVFLHVTHWGHTHSRVNEYLADFSVRAEQGRWRIARFDVREQQRLELED
ncbi:MAG: hypothetical protein AAGD14_08135 [Planctomycetota bacterium]